MKILITGSNGIIGQQLLLHLLSAYPTAEFIVINRKPSILVDKNRIQSIDLDLLNTNENAIRSVMINNRPELLFHLAWDTNHSDYLNTLDNIKWEEISKMLIDVFYDSGGKRFIGIGSSIEYDWNMKNPFRENSSPLSGNKWLYGQSKLRVFKYLTSLANISYLWCRVFFVFGPNQGNSRLVPRIINNALFGDLPISLNLQLKRDYISTFEIARQMVMMQKTEYSGAVNICSGRTVELGYIVDSISGILKKTVTWSPVTYQDGFEIESLGGSIKLINQYYKEYTYSLKNFDCDIEKTIDFIRVNNYS
ncbi:MAG: NAD-dependent epimerase/dehydratase family protein [Chitinophagaceae bacterium]|nr:NAD-dependent epimerase/dehydratase family protein [Chitinophagaceae bacterium]